MATLDTSSLADLFWTAFISVTLCVILILVIWGFVRTYRFYQSTYARATGNGYLQTMRDPGMRGEYAVACALERSGAGKHVLFNVYVPRPDGTTSEVDVLAIMPWGIIVLESKNYSGWIFGSQRDATWTQTLNKHVRNSFPNPIRQNEGHIRALQEYLKLDRSLFVSLIVFSDKCQLKKLKINSDVPVVHVSQIPVTLKKMRASRKEQLSPEDVKKAFLKLKACTRVSEETKRRHIENLNSRR